MTGEPACAAPGCDNPVVRRHGKPGRPAIYCSPACRPSRVGRRGQLSIEVDQQEDAGDSDGPHPGRAWVVLLRRGPRTVIVGRDLGRFSATALAAELRQLLSARQEGDAIE